MVGRAEKATAEGTVAEGLNAAGAVEPRGRVAAGAVKTAEVSRARGCGTGGATKVARLVKASCRAAGVTEVTRLAEAGDFRSAGAPEVARLAGARGCCAAEAAKVAGLAGAGCWAESEGGMGALGHRDGCGGGTFLGLQGGEACLALPEDPCRFFDPSTGSGGVAVQSGELLP